MWNQKHLVCRPITFRLQIFFFWGRNHFFVCSLPRTINLLEYMPNRQDHNRFLIASQLANNELSGLIMRLQELFSLPQRNWRRRTTVCCVIILLISTDPKKTKRALIQSGIAARCNLQVTIAVHGVEYTIFCVNTHFAVFSIRYSSTLFNN